MNSYIPVTEQDEKEMLKTIGVKSTDELFEVITKSLRLKNPLELPPALGESALIRHMQNLANRNADANRFTSFLGAGSYRHFIPAIIPYLLSRGEFLTSYTPYQAEVSQGTLQALYEFQTFIAELTGMDIANSSLYDGATALVEAVIMANRINHKNVVAISSAVHPEYRETLRTYLGALGFDIYEIPIDENSGTSLMHPTLLQEFPMDDISCVILQYPNFFGIVENLLEARTVANSLNALLIVSVSEPIALGILNPPGEYGADIVVGEGQSFGIPPSFGGPNLGLLATRRDYVQQIPGRLVERTQDENGNEAYTIALASREQHIRRKRATSNICTNETLLAIAATIFLTSLGPKGLREMADQNLQKTAYAKELIASTLGYDIPFSGYTFNEFVVRSLKEKPAKILEYLRRRNIFGGVALERWYGQFADSFLISVTELNTTADIDELAYALAEAQE